MVVRQQQMPEGLYVAEPRTATSLPQGAARTLPNDWIQKEHAGRKYWVNTATRESTWARPAKPEPQRGEMANPLHAPGRSAWVQKGDEEQAEV